MPLSKQVPCPTVRLLLLFFLLTAVAVVSSAQSADRILKQASKALGGEKALRTIKSAKVKGSITRIKDGEGGVYQAATMRPNLFTSAYDVRGFEVSSGYNGKSGWSRDSREGLRTLTGPASRDFQAEALYRNGHWLDYKRDKSKVSFNGPATIEGRTTNSITLTTARNARIKMFFDSTSNLLIREEIPAGEANPTFDYSDYRAIDGVMEPHTITAVIGGERYQIKLDEVAHNPALVPSIFDFPKVSEEALPDIPTLLENVGANADAIDALLEKYTYTETISSRTFDKSGAFNEKENETFELTFYKGNRIRRQTAKNGQALSADDQTKEDKRLEKRIQELEKRETEKEKKAQTQREGSQESDSDPIEDRRQRPSIADVLRGSRLINPRRERFRAREVIVFDFEPLPGYKPKKVYERIFGKLAGVIWIDAADKQVARVEARLVGAFKIGGGVLASLKEGGAFTLEHDRINNEIWLPTHADISLSVRLLVVKNIDAFQTIDYGNYKRFNVDAEKEKLQSPVTGEKKPPF